MAFGPQRLIGESNMTDTVTKERTGPGAGGGGGLPWKGSEVCTQSLPVTSSMSSFFLLTSLCLSFLIP